VLRNGFEPSELSEADGASEPVTRHMVAARLSMLEDARAEMLDDLAILQGKILGLREILTSDSAATENANER